MATISYIMKHKENIGHGGLPEFEYGIYSIAGKLLGEFDSHPNCVQNKIDRDYPDIIPISPVQLVNIQNSNSIKERNDYTKDYRDMLVSLKKT